LKELIFQLEIYVQILYMVLLYQRAKQPSGGFEQDETKIKAYKLLFDLIEQKKKTLEKLNLPEYSFSLASIQPDDPKKEPSNIVLKMHPQVSYFQSPLLEIAPEVYKQLTKQSAQNQTQASSLLGQSTNYAVSITMQNEASDRFLKRYQPLINPFLLPIATNTADAK
jgi:hypothetical protein